VREIHQFDEMSTRNPNLDAATPPDHSPSPPPSLHTPEKAHLSSSPDKRSIPVRMFDSFRRDPNQTVTETGEIIDLKLHGHDDSYDIESAINNIAKSPLSRKLEARHLQMIAIGGAIGTSSICLFEVITCLSRKGRSRLTWDRYWTVCGVRKSSCGWWTRFTPYCI
jgi:hypothetical protein